MFIFDYDFIILKCLDTEISMSSKVESIIDEDKYISTYTGQPGMGASLGKGGLSHCRRMCFNKERTRNSENYQLSNI